MDNVVWSVKERSPISGFGKKKNSTRDYHRGRTSLNQSNVRINHTTPHPAGA